MDVQSKQIVDAARSFIGTKFRHQGRRKAQGADKGGVDCLGLLVGVAAECGLEKNGQLLCGFDETDYGHIPNAIRLSAALLTHLDQVEKDEMKAADVLLMRIDSNAQHLGIVAQLPEALSLIHAYAPARGVVEHRLDKSWLECVDAVFRF